MKRTLAAAAFLFSTQASAIEFFSGNDLYSHMQKDVVNKAISLGYVQGVFDAYSSLVFCPPSGQIAAGQIHDMIFIYLQQNPAKRHYSAAQLIAERLRSEWPCPQNNGRRLL